MPVRLVTFDCAETLVKVDWRADRFAVASARAAGIDVPPGADAAYAELYQARLPEFLRVNLTRDPAQGAAFYHRLATEWLTRLGLDPTLAGPMQREADRLAFGPHSTLFEAYPDALPALKCLRERGVRLAVISNWDYSLHRVLRMFGLDEPFELVLASLEEGVEKPDPRLFALCLDRLGVSPEETLHVGDNPEDDVAGAEAAGIRPVLIDRGRPSDPPGRIASLLELTEAIAWTA